MSWEYGKYSHRLLLGTQWRNLGRIANELEASQSGWLRPYMGGKVLLLNTSALYVEFLNAGDIGNGLCLSCKKISDSVTLRSEHCDPENRGWNSHVVWLHMPGPSAAGMRSSCPGKLAADVWTLCFTWDR